MMNLLGLLFLAEISVLTIAPTASSKQIALSDNSTSSFSSSTNLTSIPSVLRWLGHNIKTLLRNVEDDFLVNVKNIDNDIREYSRALEDILSPINTGSETTNVDPIPKPELDKIQTAIRTIQDNMWAVRAFEPTFEANVRAIETAVRDFSRNLEDKFALNKHNVENVLISSRTFLDGVRRVVRLLDDKIKENNRYLEDNGWKFVRTVEDNVQIIAKTPALFWKEDKTIQLGRILKAIYAWKRKLEYATKTFDNSFRLKANNIEFAIDFAVSALLDTVDSLKKNYAPSSSVPDSAFYLC